MAAILNPDILNLAILYSAILLFSFKLTHICHDWFPPFSQNNFTHSFWLNLMMAAIMTSTMLDSDTAILDSDTLLSSLRLTQKLSHSTLTLTQTNSIWLKLIHSHLTWWWQLILKHPPILNLAMVDSAILLFSFKLWLKLAKIGSQHLTQNILPIHSHSNWWWWPSWLPPCWIQTLPSWVQTPCYLLSDWHKNTLIPLWLWLKLIQSHSNSFILTLLDKFCHLEFCHLGFSHLSISSQTHSYLPRLVPTLWTKNFTHSFWLNLMMTAILNSAMLDPDTAILNSDTLLSSLRLTQKHSHSTLTLTQTNSIWLKLIHSHLTWWWQPSWILPSWIWPYWIQPS